MLKFSLRRNYSWSNLQPDQIFVTCSSQTHRPTSFCTKSLRYTTESVLTTAYLVHICSCASRSCFVEFSHLYLAKLYAWHKCLKSTGTILAGGTMLFSCSILSSTSVPTAPLRRISSLYLSIRDACHASCIYWCFVSKFQNVTFGIFLSPHAVFFADGTFSKVPNKQASYYCQHV